MDALHLPSTKGATSKVVSPALVAGHAFVVGCGDAGDDKDFVDINPTTDRIHDFEQQPHLPATISEAAGVDWLHSHKRVLFTQILVYVLPQLRSGERCRLATLICA